MRKKEIESKDIELDNELTIEVTNQISTLLSIPSSDIKEIVEVEENIFVATVQVIEDEEEVLKSYSYSKIENSVSEIPDSLKSNKKEYLTEEEKTQYYLDNKKLITFALKKISKPDGIDFIELEGVGTYGFVKALNTFDKSNGTRFSTYAVKCVLNEVYYFLRKEQKHLMMTDSLDKEVATDNNGNALTIGDTIANTVNHNERSVEDKLLLKELRQTLLDCISYLSDDEQYLIIYRYGLDNNIIKTQTEIANILNMSQANISKLEKTCLKKLRTILKRNNYIYDSKSKRLDCTGIPIFDLLKMDDTDNYLDRDSRENIEIGVCSLLNLDITDVIDVQPTVKDHTYLVTFNYNNRVGVLYNNIENHYEIVGLPLNRDEKFLCLILDIPFHNNFNKDDLINTKYNLNVDNKKIKKVLKTLTKDEQYILISSFGLFNNPPKTCDSLSKELDMTSTEVYKTRMNAQKKFKDNLKKELKNGK